MQGQSATSLVERKNKLNHVAQRSGDRQLDLIVQNTYKMSKL